MKFLADHDVYAITTRFLRMLGHDVVTVAELGMSRTNDTELLHFARSNQRIFVTRDRDFGSLLFLQNLRTGVIYLRMVPTKASLVHKELERSLGMYNETDLMNALLVVEPGRHRLRRFV